MLTQHFRTFALSLAYSCSIQFHTLCSRTELLRERTDLSKIWLPACCMLSHCLTSSRTDLLIGLSMIRPPLRPGEALNQRSPTPVFSTPEHGTTSPLKRGKLLIHRALSASLLDTLMVWRDTGSWFRLRTSSSFSEVSNLRKVSHMHLNCGMQTPFINLMSEMMTQYTQM